MGKPYNLNMHFNQGVDPHSGCKIDLEFNGHTSVIRVSSDELGSFQAFVQGMLAHCHKILKDTELTPICPECETPLLIEGSHSLVCPECGWKRILQPGVGKLVPVHAKTK